MNVLMVAAVDFPPDPRIEKEARALIENGYTVSLICLKGDKRGSYNGIKLVRLPFGESKLPAPFNWIIDYLLYCTIGTAYVYVHSIGSKVVHVHNPPDFLVPLLAPLRALGKRLIFDVHDPTQVLAASRLSGKFSKIVLPMLKIAFDCAALSSTYVITVSDAVAELIPVDDIIIVKNSPDDEFYTLETPDINKKVIVYCGAMVENRGLDLLMEAMKAVDNSTLLMVGTGDYLDHLKRIAPENVQFLGKVMYSDIPSILAKSSIGILPLEPTPINLIGSPNKLFEMMAVGLPTVCTSLPGLRLIADEAALFVPYSVKGFSNGISTLLSDKHLYSELSATAKQKSLKFRWKTMSVPLIDLYNKIESGDK